jgi:hypothetical protein
MKYSDHSLANEKVKSLEQLISQFYHSMIVGHTEKNRYGQPSIVCADPLHTIHLIGIAQ